MHVVGSQRILQIQRLFDRLQIKVHFRNLIVHFLKVHYFALVAGCPLTLGERSFSEKVRANGSQKQLDELIRLAIPYCWERGVGKRPR